MIRDQCCHLGVMPPIPLRCQLSFRLFPPGHFPNRRSRSGQWHPKGPSGHPVLPGCLPYSLELQLFHVEIRAVPTSRKLQLDWGFCRLSSGKEGLSLRLFVQASSYCFMSVVIRTFIRNFKCTLEQLHPSYIIIKTVWVQFGDSSQTIIGWCVLGAKDSSQEF